MSTFMIIMNITPNILNLIQKILHSLNLWQLSTNTYLHLGMVIIQCNCSWEFTIYGLLSTPRYMLHEQREAPMEICHHLQLGPYL